MTFNLPTTLGSYDADGSVPPKQGGSLAFKQASVTFETTTSTAVATLPTGAYLVDIYLNVTTAFDDGTSAVLDIGTAADADAYVDNLDVTSAGFHRLGDAADMPTGATLTTLTEETTVNALVTLGSTATEGEATIVFVYAIFESP